MANSFKIFKFDVIPALKMKMKTLYNLIPTAILSCFAISVSKAQVVSDTIGNTIVEISVVLDSSNFEGGYSSGPWDLYWGPDEKLWYTNQSQLCTYDPVSQSADTILSLPSGFIMAVTTHSDFFNNPYVYITVDTAYYYGGGQVIELYRYDYSLSGDSLYNPQFILKWKHPGEHSGGRIIFGNDDKIYVSTAEYWLPHDTLFYNSGKVLRINPDGTVPIDNPRLDYTFTSGHRNPQGIVQVPNGNLFVSEYGQQWDELNLLQENGFFGWLVFDGVTCMVSPDTCNYYDSLIVYPIDVAMNPPSGIDYYDHPAIPEFNGLVQAVTAFLKQGIIVYAMNAQFDSVLLKNYYLTQEYGRVRDVCTASDGSLYFIARDRSVPDIRRIRNPLFSDVAEVKNSEYKLYPNPVHDFVTYTQNSPDKTILTITDITGRNIFVQHLNGYSGKIDLSNFTPGWYFAIFKSTSGNVSIHKLIKE